MAPFQPNFVWPVVVWPSPAHNFGSWWAIGRVAGAPHAAREELVIVVLEDGSIEPKPREPHCHRRLQVEVEICESRAGQRRLRAVHVEAISVHRRRRGGLMAAALVSGRRRRSCRVTSRLGKSNRLCATGGDTVWQNNASLWASSQIAQTSTSLRE